MARRRPLLRLRCSTLPRHDSAGRSATSPAAAHHRRRLRPPPRPLHDLHPLASRRRARTSGLTAATAALRWPGCRVTAIDRLASKGLPHFEVGFAGEGGGGEGGGEGDGGEGGGGGGGGEDGEGEGGGGARVRYVRADVQSEVFLARLAQEVEAAAPRPTALIGVHLCGRLSLRAVEAFSAVRGVRALVLSPCCLPKRSAAEADEDPALFQSLYTDGDTDTDAQYRRWGEFIEDDLRRRCPTATVTRGVAEHMKSKKRTVITALREWQST